MDSVGGFLEYKQRLVYSLMRAAARVALRFQLPLKSVTGLLQMAYFQEAREEQGLQLEAIAELFGKSLRTVSSLHNTYRGDFFAPEREVALRRAIAALVNHAPADRARLEAAFPGSSAVELDAAIADLVREGTVVQRDEQLHREPESHEFLGSDDVARRVDGLNRQLDVLAETVWRRLVEPDADSAAVARSYVFHASKSDFDSLVNELQQLSRDRAIAADQRYDQTRTGQRVAITLAATPFPEDP